MKLHTRVWADHSRLTVQVNLIIDPAHALFAGLLRRDDCVRKHGLPNRMVSLWLRRAAGQAQGQVVVHEL